MVVEPSLEAHDIKEKISGTALMVKVPSSTCPLLAAGYFTGSQVGVMRKILLLVSIRVNFQPYFNFVIDNLQHAHKDVNKFTDESVRTTYA
jgi:hypothetical protein